MSVVVCAGLARAFKCHFDNAFYIIYQALVHVHLLMFVQEKALLSLTKDNISKSVPYPAVWRKPLTGLTVLQ